MTILVLFAFVVAPETDCEPLLRINGTSYAIVRRIEARSDGCAKWLPILEVEEKGTAPRSKPTKESRAEQP